MPTLTLRTNEMWARYELRPRLELAGLDVILWSVEKHDGVLKGAFRRFLPLFAHHLCAPDSPSDGHFRIVAVEDVMSESLMRVLTDDNWSPGGIIPRNAIGQRLLATGAFSDPSFQMPWPDFLKRYCK